MLRGVMNLHALEHAALLSREGRVGRKRQGDACSDDPAISANVFRMRIDFIGQEAARPWRRPHGALCGHFYVPPALKSVPS
jgi:hypothetical protein